MINLLDRHLEPWNCEIMSKILVDDIFVTVELRSAHILRICAKTVQGDWCFWFILNEGGVLIVDHLIR